MGAGQTKRFDEALRAEAAVWIWEQLQEEGVYLAGELVDLVLETERELGLQGAGLDAIADALAQAFVARGVVGSPFPVDAPVIRAVLEWEDEFLGFAGIPRAES